MHLSKSALPLAVALLAGTGPADAAAAPDAPPSTPSGLVARAYGPTAGGIRWERSSDDRGAVAGYEIVHDGVVLGVRDTLSHVDLALSPGTVHRFAVTAIDSAGQRSGASVARSPLACWCVRARSGGVAEGVAGERTLRPFRP